MNDIERRRVDDSGIWRVIKVYPILGGLALTLISFGGYLATLRYIGDHLNKIDGWISSQENAATERNIIMARLTTLQEVTNKRLDKLEDRGDRGR